MRVNENKIAEVPDVSLPAVKKRLKTKKKQLLSSALKISPEFNLGCQLMQILGQGS